MEVSKEVGKAELIDRLLKMSSPKKEEKSAWIDTKKDSINPLEDESVSVSLTERSGV